jgi:hypothetical protein
VVEDSAARAAISTRRALSPIITTFRSSSLDLNRLRAFTQPVLFALGGRSNPDYYGRMAVRAGAIFSNLTVTLFEQRHHFDPPHRIEPERTARVLRVPWGRVGEC